MSFDRRLESKQKREQVKEREEARALERESERERVKERECRERKREGRQVWISRESLSLECKLRV